ncbi:uncharacterized protein [Ptychodera flava]|uniref:uncharacterized protein n=1 Tax=Ptychodera flava TaxID=63121 RepID=UPI00396A89BD
MVKNLDTGEIISLAEALNMSGELSGALPNHAENGMSQREREEQRRFRSLLGIFVPDFTQYFSCVHIELIMATCPDCEAREVLSQVTVKNLDTGEIISLAEALNMSEEEKGQEDDPVTISRSELQRLIQNQEEMLK